MIVHRLRAAFVALCLLAPVVSHAGPYDSIAVFGDSLSDGGSDLALSSSIHALNPAFPIVPGSGIGGHFSNGTVAVEVLAQSLGLPLTPHYLTPPFLGGVTGGTNYAQGGALAGTTNAILPSTLTIGPNTVSTGFAGVLGQVNDYLSTAHTADPNALYVVWGGANDILFFGQTPILASCVGSANPGICTALTNTATSIGELLAAGARHILVPNLTDIGKTPSLLAQSAAAQSGATQLSIGFNTGLAGILAGFESAFPDTIIPFDTFDLFNQVLTNASNFGFSDITDACLSGSTADVGSVITPACAAAGPDSYLFWDGVHPTTRAQQFLGAQFALAVGVPEPSEMALIFIGLFALVALVRRGKRR
jgi:phospholipase/lecithinase/hemolysin